MLSNAKTGVGSEEGVSLSSGLWLWTVTAKVRKMKKCHHVSSSARKKKVDKEVTVYRVDNSKHVTLLLIISRRELDGEITIM
jgi:hypothetical protein